MEFGALRVINEDYIEGGGGFATHGHRDMEIITYIIEGALEHKDTLGNSTIIRPGEVQRMSAGTGIRHSEFNHYKDRRTHLLQIWITPAQEGIAPGYEQKDFTEAFSNNSLTLVASQNGEQGSIRIFQDAKIYVVKADAGDNISLPIENARKGWLQLVRGEGSVNDVSLASGDGLSIQKEANLIYKATKPTEFLLFDLP